MTAHAITPPKPGSGRQHYHRLSDEDRKAYHHRTNMRKYGITPEQYDAMEVTQEGRCAICGKPETRRGNTGEVKRLAVDHDHKTGRVRGLLCHMCNIGVGHFEDDVDTMRAAIQYLENT